MGRPKKPVPMHLAEDFTVARGQVNSRNTGGALETGKTGFGHPLILARFLRYPALSNNISWRE